MTPFTEAIIKEIKSIPYGKVATYGQIATKAGNHRGARQVARVLHSMTHKHELPWQRIINSKGCIALKEDGFQRQKEALEAEGVFVAPNGKIDLEIYGWSQKSEGESVEFSFFDD